MPMKSQKAIWRIDLAAGAVGACLGLLLSYNPVAELLARQKQHRAFQELVGSPVVQTELTSLKAFAAARPSPSEEWLLRTRQSEFSTAPRYYAAVAALIGSNDGWPVDKNGVATLFFQEQDITDLERDYSAPSGIRRQGGEIVHDSPPPGAGEYLALTPLPLIGFLLPWVVRRFRSRPR